MSDNAAKPEEWQEPKWIVPKKARQGWCEDCGEQTKKRVTVDTAARKVHSKCVTCEHEDTYRLREYFDARACEVCGHVRQVRVRFWYDDDKEPYYNKRCDACDHIAQAESYEWRARKHRAQAREILLKRQERKS